MKLAILGAGISGLSIGNLLNERHEVTLLENQPFIGGLIKCERINNCLFHKVGGHVFNSKNETVLNWFWSFFDRENEFLNAKRNAKVFINGEIIGYPIENFIYNFDKQIVVKIVNEIFELQKLPLKSPLDFTNFEEFLKANFGETLYSIYFEPYNKKIWQVDLKLVPMHWLEGKLPMPNYSEIILNNILREEENNMVHSTFFYPKFNGSQFIVDRLSRDLDIKHNFNIVNCDIRNGKIIFNSDIEFDKVVYTGDIRNIPSEWKDILKMNGIDVARLESLKANGTSNLFCETDDTDISWLYIPESFTKAHRIIYTGNFSDTNNRGSNRKTCVVEFSGEVSYHTMVNEIKKLPGNLLPIAHNYEPNSYVVQQQDTRQLIAETKAILQRYGIYLLGRFAEWEYYNIDKAIEAAMALKEEINKEIYAID